MNVETIVKNTDISLRMEGLVLTDDERLSIKKCLEGKKDFSDAVADIVKQYSKPVRAYA
ncbi:MAG: hypothetical protein II103_07915 [Treponema sp.]|jgi:hypothetical protein|nr:hypothetical protein [Treponema sp.]MBQ1591600.1 hypothetical protein [Treponema sp.]MBQ1644438.1 hypothetical protein [Treponema sp.]MBQ1728476.1 hypothetical protein [Treponema sp.]MBQ1795007.1 hypothetical protein [Treponema sp.]